MHPRRKSWIGKTVTRLLILCSTAGGLSAWAMPPHPDLSDKIRSGKLSVPACNRDAGQLPALTRGFDLAPLRATGATVDSFRALTILVQFSDLPAQTPAADFDTLVYQAGSGSVRDFYSECSYGRLDLVTVNLPSSAGWLSAPGTQAYYANGEFGLGATSYPRNAQKLVEEAVALADAQVDFSRYDNDLNGWVDLLMIVHSGPGAEFTGNSNHIWSHKWSIAPQLRDGVFLAPYTMMPEFWASPGDITIGVFAHELGHGFGLPDLYDTDYSSRGVGRWSVMAAGAWNGILGNSPAHFDAWCKLQLGFTSPLTPTISAQGAALPQVETDSVIYRLWDGGALGNEYFLVENRQRVGFDASLPGSGLIIWHVDEGVTTDNDNEWYPGYTSAGHYLVALEQADGLWQIEQNLNYGDGGDSYPGSTNKRTFNSTTTPNSLAYSGAVSFVTVSNISDSDSLMTADFSVSLASDVDSDLLPSRPFLVRNAPNPFNAGTRITVDVDRPGPVQLEILDLLGRVVRKLGAAGVQIGSWQVTWDGRDEAGRQLGSGVYWYRASVGSRTAWGRMVMIK
jgi:immune inhibitor A